jgi:histidinol phosphatase-like enzyme
VDLARSWLIGDNLTDIKAGREAGCRAVLLGRMKCELCRLMDEEGARPDMICASLLEASRIIVPALQDVPAVKSASSAG